MHPDETIHEQALRWAVSTGDPAFEEWEAFTAWLERDPAHGEAYDTVLAAVADGAETFAHRPAPMPAAEPAANDDETPSRAGIWTRRWFAPALAACLATIAFVWVWQTPGADRIYSTAPGETRQVALGDGSTIRLAGGSRLIVAADDARSARLERGRALLHIRHDESDPFRLVAGRDTLVDAGTVFDVRLDATGLEVAVGEGAVLVNPAAQRLRLDAGERLVRRENTYIVSPVAPAEVGEWSEGRVTFRDAPLARIAADLAANTGIAFRVAPDSANVRYSGSIALDPLRADPQSLQPLLGVRVRRVGKGWELSAD